ncbi:MAG: hypothetical protein PHV33_08020 [Elusimicrobiales bacterium]|nr:hypothetical protein [Elusimicrobiales bacterium]
MRKLVAGLMFAAAGVSVWLRDGYGALVAVGVGVLIGLSLRKKKESDERDIRVEMLSNYAAMAAVMAFAIVMQAVVGGDPAVAQAYSYMLYVFIVSWAASNLIFRKAWN